MKRVLIVFLALPVLLLVACGDDDPAPDTTPYTIQYSVETNASSITPGSVSVSRVMFSKEDPNEYPFRSDNPSSFPVSHQFSASTHPMTYTASVQGNITGSANITVRIHTNGSLAKFQSFSSEGFVDGSVNFTVH